MIRRKALLDEIDWITESVFDLTPAPTYSFEEDSAGLVRVVFHDEVPVRCQNELHHQLSDLLPVGVGLELVFQSSLYGRFPPHWEELRLVKRATYNNRKGRSARRKLAQRGIT